MSSKSITTKLRKKIQTKAILRQLEDCALNGKQLSNHQIRCAEILLKKSMPDLTAVTVQDEEGNAITPIVNITI